MSKFKRRYPDPCTQSFVTEHIFVGSLEYAARILSGLINFECGNNPKHNESTLSAKGAFKRTLSNCFHGFIWLIRTK